MSSTGEEVKGGPDTARLSSAAFKAIEVADNA